MSDTIDWRRGAPLLICFAPLADPWCPRQLLDAYADCGVDVAEVAAPTLSAPLDGPIVADSMVRAATRPDAADEIRALLRRARVRNPTLRFVALGYPDSRFADLDPLVREGVFNGVLPLAGAYELPIVRNWILEDARLARIGFASAGTEPTPAARLREARGYVMVQSYDGPTGRLQDPSSSATTRIAQLRAEGVSIPLVLGFGISTPAAAARAIELGADGVVVGSACIRAAIDGFEPLQTFLRSLRDALDSARP